MSYTEVTKPKSKHINKMIDINICEVLCFEVHKSVFIFWNLLLCDSVNVKFVLFYTLQKHSLRKGVLIGRDKRSSAIKAD